MLFWTICYQTHLVIGDIKTTHRSTYVTSQQNMVNGNYSIEKREKARVTENFGTSSSAVSPHPRGAGHSTEFKGDMGTFPSLLKQRR